MRYPHFLTNKINLIAPSFGCTTDPYKSRLGKMIENFKKYDIECIKGENIYNSIGYRSNTSKLCAKEFIEAYKENNFMLSVGGGNLLNEILDDIDFSYLKKLEPTFFMGYSDNTHLTFLLTTLCDVCSIYGYNAPEFGSYELDESQIDQLKLMKGEKLTFEGYPKFELNSLKSEINPYASYNLDSEKIIKTINYAPFSGRLIGGCLDSLTYLVGTKYDKVDAFLNKYKDDGIIWFLESCDLDPSLVKMALMHMKRAGWFKYVKGFIFGRPYKYNDTFINLTHEEAIISTLKSFNVPIIINADFGHLKPCLSILCGSFGNIEVTNNNINIKYILK